MKFLLSIFCAVFFAIISFGQTQKDSLMGSFIGHHIVSVFKSGGIDTLENQQRIVYVGNSDISDCLVKYIMDDTLDLGFRRMSTFEMDLCDRPNYFVNKDSLIFSEDQGTIYFFGEDSILALVSVFNDNFERIVNEFRGVRDPNYQSISPPLTQQDLKVFPNPTNNQVTIQFPEPGTLKVFNMLGQVQVNVHFSEEHQLNVEHWSEGVYIVELEVEGAKIRQRVVVQ